MQRSSILAVECVLGSQTLTFETLEERFGVENMRKVFSGSGIRNRRVAPPGVCGSDLAFEAAENLFAKYEVDRSSIDFLIHCTQTPDYLLPTTACILQDRLQLRKNCGAFDLNLGCSQYVYAMTVASSLIASGVATNVLVLTGDTMSQTVHPMDRAVVPILGDAGSATVVGAVGEGEGFLGFELGTDGAGHKYLINPASGFRVPRTAETAIAVADKEGNVRSQENFFMNGAAVFHFAITTVPKTVQKVLEKVQLSMDQVDLFLFHQANRYMLDYLVKKLQIPADKTHFFVEETGNTSGTTMPGVLSDAIRLGKVKPGALVLMIVFGVGLSWAATVVRWPEKTLPLKAQA
jgi:3-oxoacyl-[acyl-carrier-protein] synthase-3